MKGKDTTLTHSQGDLEHAFAAPSPAGAALFAGGQPSFQPFTLLDGSLRIGRGEPGEERPGFLALDDERVSREHATITWFDGRWRVEDLGSRRRRRERSSCIARSCAGG